MSSEVVSAWLHVVAIVGALGAGAIVIWCWPGRPTWGRGLGALGVLVSGLVIGLVGVHACDAGMPLAQWIVPSVAGALSVLFCRSRRVRWGAAVVALAVALASSLHYASVVHGPSWVGNPSSRTLEGQVAIAEWHTPLTLLWRREPL